MTSFVCPYILFLRLSIRALCGSMDPASPGIYLRVSDAYEWIRATLCDNSNAPRPDYLDCENSINPQVGPAPARVSPSSPVVFRYDIFNDFFLFEAGIILEKITGVNNVEIVEYVVPGSLLGQTVLTPDADLSVEVLLESGALYSFVMVDGEGDGLSTATGQETLSDASKSTEYARVQKEMVLSSICTCLFSRPVSAKRQWELF